jgi:hypothetical protein
MKKASFLTFSIILILSIYSQPALSMQHDGQSEQVIGKAKLLTVEILSDPEELKKAALKVFMDCTSCDMDFIREEMPFVNFVRDRAAAEVHIMVTTRVTAGGGREYNLDFIGQDRFSEIRDTLTFFSQPTDTPAKIRNGLLKVLKLGVIPYVLKTPIAELINISFREQVAPTAVEDKWNSWVFNLGVSGNASGQKTINSFSYNGNLSINRVTLASKFRLGGSINFDKRKYDFDDVTFSSSSRSQRVRSLYVKSLGEHWSLGGYADYSSSTYSNLKYDVGGGLGLEFSLFPYSQSSRRLITLLYEAGYTYSKYREETIFDKLEEGLFGESLTFSASIKETWGNLFVSLEGFHYFYDFGKNRLTLDAGLSVYVLKGVSIDVWGGYTQIHDQISLPKRGATYEEILLLRRELATDYDYYISVGFSYTFGSIYSNVVNPRFRR